MFRTATLVSLALAVFAWSYGAAAASPSAEGSSDPQEEAAQREQRIKDRTERARREALFNRLDHDGDGRISRTEFAALELPAEEAEAREEPPAPAPAERP